MAFSRFSAAALGFGAAIALLSGCAQQSNSSASVVPASLAGQTSGKVLVAPQKISRTSSSSFDNIVVSKTCSSSCVPHAACTVTGSSPERVTPLLQEGVVKLARYTEHKRELSSLMRRWVETDPLDALHR